MKEIKKGSLFSWPAPQLETLARNYESDLAAESDMNCIFLASSGGWTIPIVKEDGRSSPFDVADIYGVLVSESSLIQAAEDISSQSKVSPQAQ